MTIRDEDKSLRVPFWAWGIMAAFGTATFTLIIGFFVWLGTTVIGQGQAIAVTNTQMIAIQAQLSKIDNKIDNMPYAQVAINTKEIEQVKKDIIVLQEKLHAQSN